MERAAVDLPFMRPRAGKGNHVKIAVVQRETGGKDGGQRERQIPAVFNANAAADGVVILKNRVGQDDPQRKHRITAQYFKRCAFSLPAEGGRKPF